MTGMGGNEPDHFVGRGKESGVRPTVREIDRWRDDALYRASPWSEVSGRKAALP